MKPNKELLDDLLADDISPEFRATLMAKTLRSARRRKNTRRFSSVAGVIAVIGIFTFAFKEQQSPEIASTPVRPPTEMASRPPLNPPPIASAKLDTTPIAVVSDFPKPNFTEIETTAADRPREINDKELLALAGNQPVALIHQAAHKAELIFLNSKDERAFGVQ